MKANQGVIVFTDQAADHSRLRLVLQDWGYSEEEIKQLLNEMNASQSHLSRNTLVPSTPN